MKSHCPAEQQFNGAIRTCLAAMYDKVIRRAMSPRNSLHTHIHHTYIHCDKATHKARLPSLKREKNGENNGPLTLLPDDRLNGD